MNIPDSKRMMPEILKMTHKPCNMFSHNWNNVIKNCCLTYFDLLITRTEVTCCSFYRNEKSMALIVKCILFLGCFVVAGKFNKCICSKYSYRFSRRGLRTPSVLCDQVPAEDHDCYPERIYKPEVFWLLVLVTFSRKLHRKSLCLSLVQVSNFRLICQKIYYSC